MPDDTTIDSSTAFLTITLGGPRAVPLSPGDTDPAIPAQLAGVNNVALHLLDSLPNKDPLHMRALAANIQGYLLCTCAATRGSRQPWWRNVSPSSNEMTYMCDTGLGKPADLDCSQMEWHQLKSKTPSDTLTVGPQNPTILYSSTCIAYM